MTQDHNEPNREQAIASLTDAIVKARLSGDRFLVDKLVDIADRMDAVQDDDPSRDQKLDSLADEFIALHSRYIASVNNPEVARFRQAMVEEWRRLANVMLKSAHDLEQIPIDHPNLEHMVRSLDASFKNEMRKALS
jgi:hypothetical protein